VTRLRIVQIYSLFLALCVSSLADVATDGSVGPASNLAGPDFQIPETLGKTVGGNLFHSFAQFDVSQTESATFTGEAGIQNILARVTGGSASTIDGRLSVAIANANLFLINRHGIVFGPNARLDLTGTFVATTADHIKLADGGHFDAINAAADVLTTAPPSAFGFVNAQPSPVSLQGSQLAVSAGKDLLIISGEMTIDGDGNAGNDTHLAAPGGAIALVSAGGTGSVTLTGNDTLVDISTLTLLNDILVQDGAIIDASAAQGGRLAVYAADLAIDNATLQANTTGAGNGRGIAISLTGNLTLDNLALVESSTSGDGDAGAITVNAATADLQRGGQIRSITESAGDGGMLSLTVQTLTGNDHNSGDKTGVRSITTQTATGSGGDVAVQATTINLIGTEVSANTQGAGTGGSVAVNATSIQTEGSDVTRDNRRSAGFSATVESGAAGQGGDVTATATDVLVFNGGEFSATTFGSGNGGNLAISADTIRIDDLNTGNFTSIRAQAWSTGDAGTMNLNADLLRIVGGDLTGSAFSAGNGSDITITADLVHLETSDGRWGNDESYSGIHAGVHNRDGISDGRAGNVTITATQMDIINRGIISARTDGRGPGGNVTLTLETLNLSEKGRIVASSRGPAPGGAVILNAKDINISVADNSGPAEKFFSNAGIEVTTSGSGAGGDARITAETLTITAAHGFRPAGILAQTTTGGGAAGNLEINVDQIVLRGDGQIQASTTGAGRAGDITVTADTILLDAENSATDFAQGIVAETSNPDAAAGAGGNIVIRATTLQTVNGAAITAGSSGFGAAGELLVEAQKVEVKSGGRINVSADSTGVARSLTVTADHILVDGMGVSPTGIFSSSGEDANAQGKPGNVAVNANLLEIFNGGEVSATTFGESDGGDVVITAQTIDLNDLNTGNFTSIRAQAWGAGHAGDMIINATTLNVFGGDISGSTFSSGNGGEIRITADDIHLETSAGRWGNDESYSGVHAGAHNRGGISEGEAGDVTITADSLTLVNRGIISARTDGLGGGGDVAINVDQLLLKDKGRIVATTRGQGTGGTVDVTANDILIEVRDNTGPFEKFVSNGGIEVNSRNDKDDGGPGNAGNATITANTLTVDTEPGVRPGGIFANTISPVGGSAGSLTLDVDDLTLKGQSLILASTSDNGDAGSLSLTVDNLVIEGTDGLTDAGIFTRSDSTAADAGSAGTILVNADRIRISRQGAISSASAGVADAGSVTVTSSDSIHLSGQSAISVASAEGNAGVINLQATEVLYLEQSEITARAGIDGGNVFLTDTNFLAIQGRRSRVVADAGFDGGNITLGMQYLLVSPLSVDEAISAKGEAGIDGEITLASPSIDLSGMVVDLAPEIFSILPELFNYCASKLAGTDQSSFTVSGMGGLPLDPAGLLLSAPRSPFKKTSPEADADAKE
jgi:filamentous hemagglutinin family protein